MNEEDKQKRSELKEQARAKLDDSRNRFAKIIKVGNEPAEWVAEGVFKKPLGEKENGK